jgi:hypothetical protein
MGFSASNVRNVKSSSIGTLPKGSLPLSSSKSRRSPFLNQALVLLVLLAVIGLLVYGNNQRGTTPSLTKKQPNWITISYADLVDRKLISKLKREARKMFAVGRSVSRRAV